MFWFFVNLQYNIGRSQKNKKTENKLFTRGSKFKQNSDWNVDLSNLVTPQTSEQFESNLFIC